MICGKKGKSALNSGIWRIGLEGLIPKKTRKNPVKWASLCGKSRWFVVDLW